MEIKDTNSTCFSVEGDEFSQVFYPWRRFLARTLDIFVYEIIWAAFLAFVFHVNVAARSNSEKLLDSAIALVIMLFLEPLWLHLLGTTPGKAIFGLRIKALDGRYLSYGESLERTWCVIGSGMGYNIPIYNIIRLWKSYNLCSENETQPWDESVSYTIKDTKRYRGVLYICAYVVLFAVLFTIYSAQLLPPNKGDLTIAKFAENYNYYAKLLDIDYSDEYLDETGKWEKKGSNETVIYIGHTEKPEYHFTIENGYVTGVSFAIEIKNNKYLISSYDTQMFLAALAFASAQNEMRLFSKIPNRIADQINNNTLKSFHFVEAGTTFVCNIEQSGYKEMSSRFLHPEEDVRENYFSLSFSINKQK